MKLYLDCIPCYLRQALEAIRMVSDDKNLHEKVLRQAVRAAAEFDPDAIGLMTQYEIQKIIKKLAPGGNPYKEAKDKSNKICLDLTSDLRIRIRKSSDPFQTSLRIALAGNIIDFGPKARLGRNIIMDNIEDGLIQELDIKSLDALRQEIIKAEKILYIGDNAGEIVLDMLFIENLPKEKITYAVRGGPALNDATIEDARMIGLDKVVKVITTGLDMPAAILPMCSGDFLEEYKKSDLVISKGQGNYEALSDEDKNIFFLLKMKCPVIVQSMGNGYGVGDIVIYKKERNS
jgi:uncharacterized protein with ATP-grasp and redox domains